MSQCLINGKSVSNQKRPLLLKGLALLDAVAVTCSMSLLVNFTSPNPIHQLISNELFF